MLAIDELIDVKVPPGPDTRAQLDTHALGCMLVHARPCRIPCICHQTMVGMQAAARTRVPVRGRHACAAVCNGVSALVMSARVHGSHVLQCAVGGARWSHHVVSSHTQSAHAGSYEPPTRRSRARRAQLLGEDAAKTAHFAKALREVFQPSTDPLTMEVAAATLGHLVKSGGALTADIVEFEARGPACAGQTGTRLPAPGLICAWVPPGLS